MKDIEKDSSDILQKRAALAHQTSEDRAGVERVASVKIADLKMDDIELELDSLLTAEEICDLEVSKFLTRQPSTAVSRKRELDNPMVAQLMQVLDQEMGGGGSDEDCKNTAKKRLGASGSGR